MTELTFLWGALGGAAGMTHAWLLWQAAQQPGHASAVHAGRLVVTVLVLSAAAYFGAILPAFIGWSLAYFVAVGTIRFGLAR